MLYTSLRKVRENASVYEAYENDPEFFAPLAFLKDMSLQERTSWIENAISKYDEKFGNDAVPAATKCLLMKLYRKEQQRRRKTKKNPEMSTDEIADLFVEHFNKHHYLIYNEEKNVLAWQQPGSDFDSGYFWTNPDNLPKTLGGNTKDHYFIFPSYRQADAYVRNHLTQLGVKRYIIADYGDLPIADPFDSDSLLPGISVEAYASIFG